MRPAPSPRVPLLLLLACVVGLGGPLASRAWADDPRAEAKGHYQSGVKLYNSGDYPGAIREFSAAQQIAPADLNNYNLALCYDKLGDAGPAIQYYRAYLDKAPNAEKRAEIEASITRLEAAQSSATKKLDDRRAAEDARRAEEARRVEEARRAEDARKAEDARRADEAKRDDSRRTFDSSGGPASTSPGVNKPVPSGDPQLDRINSVDIGAIRGQRTTGAGGIDPRTVTPPPPAGTGAMTNAPPPPNGNQPPVGAGVGTAPTTTAAAGTGPGGPTDTKTEDPVYKKWWFWAVVGVSAYVVYSIATESSHNTTSRGREAPAKTGVPQPGGLTLFRW